MGIGCLRGEGIVLGDFGVFAGANIGQYAAGGLHGKPGRRADQRVGDRLPFRVAGQDAPERDGRRAADFVFSQCKGVSRHVKSRCAVDHTPPHCWRR